jgi:hypothetical protein
MFLGYPGTPDPRHPRHQCGEFYEVIRNETRAITYLHLKPC